MENITVSKIKNRSKVQNNNNLTIFSIQYVSDEPKPEKGEALFFEYSRARKNAISYVNRRNAFICKRLNKEVPDRVTHFTETEPDVWTNGDEMIRINAIELKNN